MDEEVGGIAQGTGSWERSATFAKFFLQGALRTCGTHERAFCQEIFPWQAYTNDDGYLVAENPPPPPPRSEDGFEILEDTPTGKGASGQASPLKGIWTPYPQAAQETTSGHQERLRQATKLLEEAIAAIPDEIANMPAETKRPVPEVDTTSICASAQAHLGDWSARLGRGLYDSRQRCCTTWPRV